MTSKTRVVLSKGSNFTGLLRAVGERGGTQANEQVLPHLPQRVAEAIRYGQVVAVGWYPVEWYAALHSAIDHVLGGGPEMARALGRDATLADFTSLHRAVARMLKIETVFGQAPRLMKLYWKGGLIECPEVSSGYGRLSFSGWHGFTRLIWEDLAGSIEAILTLCRAEDVTCSSFGSMDAVHKLEIHVTWTNHTPRTRGVSR
jgi:hypothetical protein